MINLNKEQEKYIMNKLYKLNKSKFRNSFHLNKKMIDYINIKGMEIIESHCCDFINRRLAIYPNKLDGKQTPMKNHPVFIAQHATATCCRKCLQKWHKIPNNRILYDNEKKYIQAIIMKWISIEYNKNK